MANGEMHTLTRHWHGWEPGRSTVKHRLYAAICLREKMLSTIACCGCSAGRRGPWFALPRVPSPPIHGPRQRQC